MQCTAPLDCSNRYIRCENICIGDSDHCIQHKDHSNSLYIKYKDYCEQVECIDIAILPNNIYILMRNYALLEKAYDARLEHQKYAYVPELVDKGHLYQFHILKNKITLCEHKLYQIFNNKINNSIRADYRLEKQQDTSNDTNNEENVINIIKVFKKKIINDDKEIDNILIRTINENNELYNNLTKLCIKHINGILNRIYIRSLHFHKIDNCKYFHQIFTEISGNNNNILLTKQLIITFQLIILLYIEQLYKCTNIIKTKSILKINIPKLYKKCGKYNSIYDYIKLQDVNLYSDILSSLTTTNSNTYLVIYKIIEKFITYYISMYCTIIFINNNALCRCKYESLPLSFCQRRKQIVQNILDKKHNDVVMNPLLLLGENSNIINNEFLKQNITMKYNKDEQEYELSNRM